MFQKVTDKLNENVKKKLSEAHNNRRHHRLVCPGGEIAVRVPVNAL
jgi:hypothetical protein